MKHVYTLTDLREHRLPENTKLAVLGFPIKHSASPEMHQAALDALEIDVKYVRLEIEPGSLAEGFNLMQEAGFIGCNVTIPHKLEAMECCDEVSDSVRVLGVANTIIFRDGKILGDNTDGPGLIKALEADLGFSVEGSSILLLGAGGGAGKAIATQLAVDKCSNLYLSNRTISKIESLRSNLSQYTETSFHLISNGMDELRAIAGDVDLIINATSMGMKEEDATPFPLEALTADHKVYDAIYNPAQTPLLKAAHSLGAVTANGLSMLVHQGAISFEIWTGLSPDVKLMKDAIS